MTTPRSYTTSIGYDTTNRPTTISYPAVGGLPAETVTTGYDPLGLPTTLTGTVPYVTGVTYQGDGAIATRTLAASPSPITRGYTYETTTKRLTGITTSIGATTVQNDTLTYSNAGQLTTQIDTTITPSVRTCHTYDALNRLDHSFTTAATTCNPTDTTTAAGPAGYNTSWAYTTAGNTTSVRRGTTTNTYTYTDPAHPHAATSSGSGTSYTYNTLGQMITRDPTDRGPQTLTWDPLGHLATVTEGTNTTTFTHTSDGTRLARTTPGGTTTINLPGQEIDLTAGTETTARRYYTHAGAVVAVRTPTALTWQTNDRQNSVDLQITNGTTTPKRSYTDPYGTPRTGTAPLATDKSWLGKTLDPTTGLTQLDARYYDTTLNRFTTTDPLNIHTTTQTPNPYTHAANNPTTYTDPTGLRPVGAGDTGCTNCRQTATGWTFGNETPGSVSVWGSAYTGTYYSTGTASPPPAPQTFIEGVGAGAGQAVQDVLAGFNPKTIVEGLKNLITNFSLEMFTSMVSGLTHYGEAKDVWDTCTSSRGYECGRAVGFLLVSVGADVLTYLLGAGPGRAVAKALGKAGSLGEDVAQGAKVLCKTKNSFSGDTTVLMADGSRKPIKDVELDDYVMSEDPHDGKPVPNKVSDLIRHTGPHIMVEVELDDGTTINATDEHPFWVENTQSWTGAINLHTGDTLRTAAGTHQTVRRITTSEHDLTAYNLTVEGLHTYFASNTNILVHNCGTDDVAAKSGAEVIGPARNTDLVLDSFRGLGAGKQNTVRTVGSVDEMRTTFEAWTVGAERLPARGGTIPDVYRLPDGGVVQWRTGSSSGGPTIDIVPPSGAPRKVHLADGVPW